MESDRWLMHFVLVQAAIAREAAEEVQGESDDGEPTAHQQLCCALLYSLLFSKSAGSLQQAA